MVAGPVRPSQPSAETIAAQQAAAAARAAEEARRRAEEAARQAAEDARRQAEEARRQAEAARRKAEASRLAAEAAEKKAAETKAKADADEATRLRDQAKLDEQEALKKEAIANLKEKESTLAASKLDDVRQRRAPDQPSEATRAAETEVKAAKQTMALFEPPVPGQPAATTQASARTKTLFDKTQALARPVFEAQARGEKPSQAQLDAVNQAAAEWLEAAKQDMRSAGVAAQANGQDPNAAIRARGEEIKNDIDKGGIFDPKVMGEFVDADRDAVLAESPGVRQLRSEQHSVQTDGNQQVADATTTAAKANADAKTAREYADGFTSASTDSQVTAKQEAEAEAARLEAAALAANKKLEGLQKAFGVTDPANPKNNRVGSVEAEYDAKAADLEVAELAGRRQAALDAGDQAGADKLGLQLDDAIARQRLARTRSDSLKADVDLFDAQTEKDQATAAWEAAKADQPELRTVTYQTRGGTSKRTVTPDGYDKTFWLKPGDPNVKQVDGKWVLVTSGPRGTKTETELHPATARLFDADKKLTDSQNASKAADDAFLAAHEDINGPLGGQQPGKLDIDGLPAAQTVSDNLNNANQGVTTAQRDLDAGIAAGVPETELVALRQDLGAAMQAQRAAQAQSDALKALTELRDAERDVAMGKSVDPKHIESLRTKARDAVDKSRQQVTLSPKDEQALRDKSRTLNDQLKTQNGEVERTTTAYDKATSPADKEEKRQAQQQAMDKRDALALQVRDVDSRLQLLDAERTALAAPYEYGRTTFVQPHDAMWADSQGNGRAGEVYPSNYDPTWNIKPGEVPEGVKVEKTCGWTVTFEEDSEILGVNDDQNHTSYRIKAGTYTMNPATARLWEADAQLKTATENRQQVVTDLQQDAASRPHPDMPAMVGVDGKPVPTLYMTDDLSARKPAVDKAVTDAASLRNGLQQALTYATGDTSALEAQLADATIQYDIAVAEQRAVDAMLAWQAANRNRQIDEANQRAGRPTHQGDKPLTETANDLRDTALKRKSEWLALRDKHGTELAKRKVDTAQKAHDTWKREHPYLLGSEENAQTWKTLDAARGELDLAKRQLVMSANEQALIDQQQLISSKLRPDQHDDPHQLYQLFMDHRQVMAQSVINQHYVEYGSQPMQMAGRTHIGNEVAFALGYQPSVTLDSSTPAVNAQRRQSQDLFTGMKGDQRKMHQATVDKIVELGGEKARVTVLPVVYALDGDNGGIVKTALFKVERSNGEPAKYVDDQGREYKDIDDFRANNMLPVENVDLAMPADGEFKLDDKGNVQLFTGDARTETGWETFRRKSHIDAIVGGIGFVAGVVLTVGSLGTLSVPGALMMGAGIAMMGAGTYGVVTSAQSLSNQAEHGVSVNPFTNAQARMDWMNLGLSAASIPVAGASGRAMQLAIKARDSVKAAETAKLGGDAVAFAKHMDDAASYMQRAQAWGAPAQAASKPLAVASVPVIAEGGRQLHENWDHLSGWERLEQGGMMGLNVAGFASPVFAKGYVRVHNSFKNTYQSLKGAQQVDAAAGAAPDPTTVARTPAQTDPRVALSPFYEGHAPTGLLGPDGLPIRSGTQPVRGVLLGPDGQPISRTGTPTDPAGPPVTARPAAAPAPRLHVPGEPPLTPQALIVGGPHDLHLQAQRAMADATDTPIGGDFADVARPVVRSPRQQRTDKRQPGARGGPDDAARSPARQAATPAADRAWTLPRARLDDLDQASVLYAVHAAGGRLDEVRYVVARWEHDGLTGKLMHPSRHGLPEGVPAQSHADRAATYEMAAREGIPDLVEPAYYATLDEALQATQGRAGVGMDGVFIVSDHGVAADGSMHPSAVIGTVKFEGLGPDARFKDLMYHPTYQGPLRVALPDGFQAGMPLIGRVDGRSVDFANTGPGRSLMGLNLFERRVADLVVTAEEGGPGANIGIKRTLDRSIVLSRDGKRPQLDPVPDEVPAPPGYFVLDGHGLEGVLQDADGSLAFGDEVATAIRWHPDYRPGQPVLAYVCYGARGAAPMLQRLSSALGADVYGMDVSPAITTGKKGSYTHDVEALGGEAPYNAGHLDPGAEALPIVQITENGKRVYEDIAVRDGERVFRFTPGLPIVQVSEGGRVVFDATTAPAHTHRRPAGLALDGPAPRPGDGDTGTRTVQRNAGAKPGQPESVGPEHVLIPMELMARFRALSRGGFFRNPEVEVLVYPIRSDQRGGPIALNGKANSVGLLDRDYAGIRWQDGSRAREAFRPHHVFDEFGRPGADTEYVMLIAPRGTHDRLAAGETLEASAWASDHRSMGLADGPAYTQRPHSFQEGLRGDLGATAYAGNELYFGLSKLLNRVRGRHGTGPDPLRYVSDNASFSTGRAPLPAQDLKSGLVVWDPHNHPNVFAGPHYLQMKNFLARMDAADRSLRVDGSNHITLSYEMIPYRTQALGGGWAGYTHSDVMSISSRFGHAQDLQMLHGWHDLFGELVHRLGPDEARRQQQLIIPSLTGIETYPVGNPKDYASGVGARDYLARALLLYPDAYPMVGEINGRKEMKSLLDGRGNNCCRPLSTDIGRTGTQVDEALFGVLDATRDSGMVTVLHSDWGAMEFGRDGRPIEAPGDSRDFFKLTRMLMDLGPYDMSGAPRDRPLADADVRRIVDNGVVRNPARIVLAHLGIGNWVRGSPHHLQLLRWALDHPLLAHVNFDSSWLPSIEAYAGDPGFRQQMVSLIQSGRIFYAGDQTNFQTPEQLLAPWFAQQPLLRALDKADPASLRTYASGGFRDLYENSKADMDWFRYRAATDGSSEAFIASMPELHRQRLADWVARYEAQHPQLVDAPTTRPAAPTDAGRGLAPQHPKLPMEIRLPRAPEDLPNAYDAGPDAHMITAMAADPSKPHRLDQFDAWLYATDHGRPAEHHVDDVTNLAPSRRLIHGAEPTPVQRTLPETEQLPPAAWDEVQAYMALPAMNAQELMALSQRRAERGGLPYTEEALEAGRLAASTGAPRGLQRKTMELTDIVSRRQDGNNAYLQSRNRREVAGIAVALVGVAAAMATGGHAAYGSQMPAWVGPSALWTRALSTLMRTGNQQFARKISEGVQEQSIVKPEMFEALARRLERWGPRMGLDPQRFRGDHSLQDVVEQALVDMHYMLESPLNTEGGETLASRRALLHSTFSSVLAAVDREVGAQWTGIEWTNFRTLPGGAMSMAASLAYGAGLVGNLQFLAADFGGNWYHLPLVGANGLFMGYHALGAVTGRFGHNWAELPVVRQTLNRVAWPLVSVGTAGWAAHATVAAAGAGSWQQAAIHLGTAGFAALASHATYKLTQAGWRAEGLTGQHARLQAVAQRTGLGPLYEALQFGGVDKPRAAPLRNLRAALGLTGLGAMMWLQGARADDDKRPEPQGPATPGPLPGITPTTPWPPMPSPTTAPPTRDPSLPDPSDRRVPSLPADPRGLLRGAPDALVSQALQQLIQIGPRRGDGARP
jgi:hypothetical protein